MICEEGEVKDWAAFERRFNFELTVYDLITKAIPLIAGAFPGEKPFIAFAFTCSSAYGDLSVSVGSSANCMTYDPPDWEHECVENESPEIVTLWKNTYEPLRDTYVTASDAYCDEHGIDEWEKVWPHGFLHSLRRIMVRLERSGELRALNPSGHIRTMVTEVDADTDEEARLLEKVRRSLK